MKVKGPNYLIQKQPNNRGLHCFDQGDFLVVIRAKPDGNQHEHEKIWATFRKKDGDPIPERMIPGACMDPLKETNV
jgi:hypothetical protein